MGVGEEGVECGGGGSGVWRRAVVQCGTRNGPLHSALSCDRILNES